MGIRIMTIRASVLLIFVAITGCAAPPKVTQSQMEIQSYQSREFETTKRIAFDSTMSVLQDSGFIIESADFETGFITGAGTTQSRSDFWWGAMNEHVKMTAFVEQRTSSVSRIRLNVVESAQRKSVWNPAQDVINESGVRDPKVYQELFEKIDQAVFIKKNL
jgi:hypothetical protein